MKEDLKWLAENVEWPSHEVNLIGLDPDGEVRFGRDGVEMIEYDYYPPKEVRSVNLNKWYVEFSQNEGYTKEEFDLAKEELK